MPRGPRYVPAGSLVEITCRTLDSRFFLQPTREFCEAVHGILARAATMWAVDIVAWVYLSNHAHLLVRPRDAFHLARFMGQIDTQISKEVNRKLRRRGKMWGRRYRPIIVAPDQEEARLRYLLSHGAKELLVRSPTQWPGPSAVPWLLGGGPVEAVWFDRTAEYEARRRGERFGRYAYATKYRFDLVPLPSWSHLSKVEIRERYAQMIREIEAETRERLRREDKTVLGAKRVRRIDPWHRPETTKRSPAPPFHTKDPGRWRDLHEERREFRQAYAAASAELRAGNLEARFPIGSFPPALPFFPARAPNQLQ